jgi:PAS domain S-box-containing protein
MKAVKLSDQATLLISLPLFFQLIFVLVFIILLEQARSESWQDQRFRAVLAETNRLEIIAQETVLNLSFSVLRLQTKAERNFPKNMLKGMRQVEVVESLMSEDPEQSKLIPDLRAAANEVVTLWSNYEKFKEEGFDVTKGIAASELRKGMVSPLKRFTKTIEQITLAQERQKHRIGPNFQQLAQYGLLAVLPLNVLLAVMLMIYFQRTTARRLDVLKDNTQRIGMRMELSPALEPGDELGDFDALLHKMATDLAKASRREQALTANAVDVICSLNPKLTFVTLNPAALTVFGFQPDKLIGERLSKIVLPEDLSSTESTIRKTEAEGSTASIENSIIRSDGAIRHMLWSVQWSRDEKLYFCVVRDITERKEMEKLKQEFFAMVSHDIRTPLMAVQLSLDLIASGSLGQLQEPVLAKVRNANENVDYVTSLIKSLLDAERYSDNQLELSCAPFELAQVVEESITPLTVLLLNKHVEIVTDSVDWPAWGDQARIKQVLINLISNAIKFSPEGGQITVSAQPEGEWLKVNVADQGRGVPGEFQQKIFDKYKQVQVADATIKGGSGLGLAICKTIVKAHGGEIGVESEVGRGSTFWFTIPIDGPA